MAVLARLYDFAPSTLIQSAQVDAEFNQIINLLSGGASSSEAVIKYSDATTPPLALDQLGAGYIQQWKLSGTEKARVDNDGSFRTVDQFISTLATGTKPIDVASTTLCTNLNADLLDGNEAAAFPTLSGLNTFTGICTFGQDVIITDDHLQINTSGSLGANNRLVVNHSESPQTDAAVSFRAGATNVRPLDVVGEASGTAGLFRAYQDNDSDPRVRISDEGKIETRAGYGATVSTSFLVVGGVLATDISSVGNVGAGEDDLISYSIPANTFAADKDFIVGRARGAYAANGNNKTVRAYIGGTEVFDSGALAINDGRWFFDFRIYRTASDTLAIDGFFYVFLTSGGGGTNSFGAFQEVSGLTLSGAVTFKMTGEATSNNDVTQAALFLEKYSV